MFPPIIPWTKVLRRAPLLTFCPLSIFCLVNAKLKKVLPYLYYNDLQLSDVELVVNFIIIVLLSFMYATFQVGIQHKPKDMKMKTANLIRINVQKDQVSELD